MKISSIDVGSNAIRQVIVEIDINKYNKNPNSSHWKTLKKFRAPIRLGTDVFKSKQISAETLESLVEAFKSMASFNKKYGVRHVVCTATSALRDSKNQALVVKHIKQQTGIQIEVISGNKEGSLIRNAIVQSKIINKPQTLLIDIGGGSLELTSVINDEFKPAVSFPLGVVRLKTLLDRQEFNLNNYIQKYIGQFKHLPSSKTYDMAIGTGGNFDALSKLKMALLKKAPQTNLTLKEIKTIKNKWNKMSLAQKQKLPIRQDRIDVLGIALDLVLFLLEKYKINFLKVPGTGLKEGLVYSALEKQN